MLMDKVNDILNSGSAESSLISLCTFVRDHIEEIPDMTISEVAAATYLSKGQVSKCVRALNYLDFKDFKDECMGYRTVMERRKQFFDPNRSFEANAQAFLDQVHSQTSRVLPAVESEIKELESDIKKASCVYLFARGDARVQCHRMLWEFSSRRIATVLCDAEFKKEYTFDKNDLLIHISTNGDSFYYDPRIVHKVKTAPVYKWLITCNKTLDGYDKILYIPTDNPKYNKFVLRNIVDCLLFDLFPVSK